MNITAEQVSSLLQKDDIEGLLHEGAPSDEYDSEAEIISSTISLLGSTSLNEQDIMGILRNVWEQSFGLTADDLDKRQKFFISLSIELATLIKSNTS